MTDDHDDLLAQLRAANPVLDAATAGRRATPEAEALLVRALRPRPRPRRAVLIAAVIAIALLVITALAGFILLQRSGAKQSAQVVCYAARDLRAHRIVVPAGEEPRRACTLRWREGRLGKGPAPNFAVCVLPSGGLAVFPGESGTTCVRLALPLAEIGHDTVDKMSVDLNNRIQLQCVGRADAIAIVRDRLHAYGLSKWSMRVDPDHPFDSANPCASVFVETASRTVVISGLPGLDQSP